MATVEGAAKDAVKSQVTISSTQQSSYIYNSGSTWPIATMSTPFDSTYDISSAVMKPVTLGDLCDIERSRVHFSHIEAIGKSEQCVRPQKMIQFRLNFFWIIFVHVEIPTNCAVMDIIDIKLNYPIIIRVTLLNLPVIINISKQTDIKMCGIMINVSKEMPNLPRYKNRHWQIKYKSDRNISVILGSFQNVTNLGWRH